jgi:hypothetical protein
VCVQRLTSSAVIERALDRRVEVEAEWERPPLVPLPESW